MQHSYSALPTQDNKKTADSQLLGQPLEMPRSTLVNRNIMVGDRRTSVRLEPEMWTALLDIARRESQTIHGIATMVSQNKKPETSLTAAIRVFCLGYYRSALSGRGQEFAEKTSTT